MTVRQAFGRAAACDENGLRAGFGQSSKDHLLTVAYRRVCSAHAVTRTGSNVVFDDLEDTYHRVDSGAPLRYATVNETIPA